MVLVGVNMKMKQLVKFVEFVCVCVYIHTN
jgi:hypothetical protein